MTDRIDGQVLKDLISSATPLIKALVDTFVTPKLVAFRDRHNLEKSKQAITEDNFTEYYHRMFKKLVVVNTLVFNNSQRLLLDIFIPLTLTLKNDDTSTFKINEFPVELSDEYGNILITDTAGMGKSTLMKRIFIDAIYKNVGIPLFIELRRLNKNKTIVNEIRDQLNSLNKEFDPLLILELLSEGGFTVILDGYDEISLSDRDIVTKDIQDFISRASNNRFFITSRPENALSSFGGFQEFKIAPLSRKEAFELLRKYDNQGQLSSLLIKRIQSDEIRNIDEFLTNPLLVSLLFTAFEHKQVIPFKKFIFYRQVYDANFESHDLTKGDSFSHDKHSGLDIDDFHRVLRHIGFNCFKIQRIEFSKDEILSIISQSKSFCIGLSFQESKFLLDLTTTVPLFSVDGNYYRWSHKSLQEYFAAQFIYLDSKGKQNDILKKLYNHPNLDKFINVLDLYYDMDYKTFRNNIELELTNEFIRFQNSHYLKFGKSYNSNSINKRRELTFLVDCYIFKSISMSRGARFDVDKFQQMIDNYKEETGFESGRVAGIIIEPRVAGCYFGFQYQNSKNSLLGLLYSKKNELVKQIDVNIDKSAPIALDCDLVEEYKLKEITDDPEDKLNSKDQFDTVNLFLEITRNLSITINANNVDAINEGIKRNIGDEDMSDFFLEWGSVI